MLSLWLFWWWVLCPMSYVLCWRFINPKPISYTLGRSGSRQMPITALNLRVQFGSGGHLADMPAQTPTLNVCDLWHFLAQLTNRTVGSMVGKLSEKFQIVRSWSFWFICWFNWLHNCTCACHVNWTYMSNNSLVIMPAPWTAGQEWLLMIPEFHIYFYDCFLCIDISRFQVIHNQHWHNEKVASQQKQPVLQQMNRFVSHSKKAAKEFLSDGWYKIVYGCNFGISMGERKVFVNLLESNSAAIQATFVSLPK